MALAGVEHPGDRDELCRGCQVPTGVVQGKGDVGRTGYLGPCPPPGTGVHHYTFTIFALKVDKLDVDPNAASGALVGFNLNGNALAKATVVYTLSP